MPSPSRSARRNQHKRLVRSLKEIEPGHCALACRWLEHWRAEARQRAQSLGAPAVWALAADPGVRELLARLDRSGELAQELGRVCAEAVAWASGAGLLGEGLKRRQVTCRQEQ